LKLSAASKENEKLNTPFISGKFFMRNTFYNTLSAIICTAVIGCSLQTKVTRPNEPFDGPFPETYYNIEKKNQLLAKEIAKLPEIRDGISPEEENALKQLSHTYLSNINRFDSIFDLMFNTGKPEHREYCSPLQSMFWLYEDGDYDMALLLLSDFSLFNLAEKAWHYNELNLSSEDLEQIVHNLPPDLRAIYTRFDFLTKRELTNKILLHHYNDKSSAFQKNDLKRIATAIAKNKDKQRWDHFETVTTRLNSPELVNIYQMKFLNPTYVSGKTGRPAKLFKKKEGNPNDFAAFSAICLRKAGYEARPIRVASKKPVGHTVCEFVGKDNELYILDNSRQACIYGKGVLIKELYIKNRPQIGNGYAIY
jgi:hypothetical protein